MLAEGQSSSAKRGRLATDVSLRLIFLKKKGGGGLGTSQVEKEKPTEKEKG